MGSKRGTRTPSSAGERYDLAPTSARATGLALLQRHDGDADREIAPDELATSLMDLYRRTGSSEVFSALVDLAHGQLLRRVRAKTRYLGERIDADELVQDAFINIYRYPDKFDASRPGAFRAWSSTIVDNAVRRHVRRSQRGMDVWLRPVELLEQEPDRTQLGPGAQAMEAEGIEQAQVAFAVFLTLYLRAYQALTERERFVLQMVEIRGMRYAELARVLGIRPEALKMVVFRARRRIFERISVELSRLGAQVREAGEARERSERRLALSCAG